MLLYKEEIQVTQEEFDTRQNDIKNIIRQKVDRLKNKFIKDIPLSKVDFLVPLKGEVLQKQYGFLFKKTTEEETDEVFAKLIVNIKIVTSSQE